MSINTPRTCHELGVCQDRPPPCSHTCRLGAESARVDTKHLPHGGYYFAPGVIENGSRHKARRLAPWQRLVLGAAVWLAVAGLLGFAAGVLQAKGWPL